MIRRFWATEAPEASVSEPAIAANPHGTRDDEHENT